MPDDNKKNLMYFESESMKGLYDCIKQWQEENKIRLLSTSIQKEGNKFCCIALTNPSEVVIVDGKGRGNRATVDPDGTILTNNYNG